MLRVSSFPVLGLVCNSAWRLGQYPVAGLRLMTCFRRAELCSDGMVISDRAMTAARSVRNLPAFGKAYIMFGEVPSNTMTHRTSIKS